MLAGWLPQAGVVSEFAHSCTPKALEVAQFQPLPQFTPRSIPQNHSHLGTRSCRVAIRYVAISTTITPPTYHPHSTPLHPTPSPPPLTIPPPHTKKSPLSPGHALQGGDQVRGAAVRLTNLAGHRIGQLAYETGHEANLEQVKPPRGQRYQRAQDAGGTGAPNAPLRMCSKQALSDC